MGQNTILIDIKDQSYLFRHGFFDENVLALKIDGKDEYAMLINESKYQGELNTISAVLEFLNQNYLANPILTKNQHLGQLENNISDVKYQRDGYTFRMGSFKEFNVKFSRGQINIYQKKSNGKYYIYSNNEIVLFQGKETCLNYIKNQIV